MTQKRKVKYPLTNAQKDHLVCRDLMHSWTWVTDMIPNTRVVDTKRVKTVTRVVECQRCQTRREDEYMLPTFERVRSMYVYPEGYLAKRHGTHLRVADIRAEVYRRMTKGAW